VAYDPKSRRPGYDENDNWSDEDAQLISGDEDTCLEEEDEDDGCSTCPK
jgi:hypothetical protein